jgi:hypothetical protein
MTEVGVFLMYLSNLPMEIRILFQNKTSHLYFVMRDITACGKVIVDGNISLGSDGKVSCLDCNKEVEFRKNNQIAATMEPGVVTHLLPEFL